MMKFKLAICLSLQLIKHRYLDAFFRYIGRKRMSQSGETRVAGTEHLVWAKYSYWTLAYIIRLSGARKLIAAEPLKQMIPVDEFIPIMFDDHTE